MEEQHALEEHEPRVLALKAVLLAVWVLVSFGACWFARDLQFTVAGWPFAFWAAAQGGVLVFIAIVVVYATAMKRLAPGDGPQDEADG